MDEGSPTNTDNREADLVYIICKANQDASLKMFVDRTWDAFKRAAEFRLALKSDRYRDTTTEVNMEQQAGNARYHSKCYRNYTAVKRPSTDSQSDSPSEKPKTRRRSSMPPSDAKGLLKGSCIFCHVQRKTINRKVEPEMPLMFEKKIGKQKIYISAINGPSLPPQTLENRCRASCCAELPLLVTTVWGGKGK